MEIDETKIIEDVSEELALSCLLASGVFFLNNVDISYTYKRNKPEYTTAVYVNASDIFMWGCADAQAIDSSDNESPSEIIELYKLWKEHDQWGAVKWLALKRNLQPQSPVIDLMKKANYWDDSLDSLPLNPDKLIAKTQ